MKEYPRKICVICKKEYKSWTSRQKCCSKECSKKLENKRPILKANEIIDKYMDDIKNKNKKTIRKCLQSKKLRVKDERIINYDSPTKKVFIGFSKKPLMEAKQGGYGYQGVLLQTDNRMFVQCHVCGKWVRYINNKHLKKHNINHEEYKKMFGFNKTVSLVPDDISYKMEKNARYLWANKEIRDKLTQRLRKQSADACKKATLSYIGTKQSTQKDNLYGNCPEQLKYRLLEYIKKYKDLPSISKKGEGGKICKALRIRHGSLNLAFKYYDLPTRHRWGTTVELVAPNKKILHFNYNKIYSKDNIYNWMKNNCLVLKT